MKFKCRPDTYFQQAVHVLSSLPPLNQLREQELLVLGELMYSEYVIVNGNPGNEYPLCPAIRDRIVAKLGMTPAAFRTTLSSLRRAKVLLDKMIHPRLKLDYLQPISFEFYEG